MIISILSHWSAVFLKIFVPSFIVFFAVRHFIEKNKRDGFK